MRLYETICECMTRYDECMSSAYSILQGNTEKNTQSVAGVISDFQIAQRLRAQVAEFIFKQALGRRSHWRGMRIGIEYHRISGVNLNCYSCYTSQLEQLVNWLHKMIMGCISWTCDDI